MPVARRPTAIASKTSERPECGSHLGTPDASVSGDPAWVQAVGRAGGRLGRGSYDGTRASCSPWIRWHTSQLAIRVSGRDPAASQFRRAESGRRCQTLPWRRLRLLPTTSDSAADDRICVVRFAGGPGDVDLRKVLQLD